MQDIQRYRNIVRSYPALQGLRIIPLGLLFLILSLQRLNLPVLGRQGDCTITLPLLLVAFASWFWVGKYYEKTFGKVEGLVGRGRLFIDGPLGLFVFIAVVVLENILFQNHLGPPFSLIEFTTAAAVLYVGIKTQRWYYTLSGALVGIASFLPLILGVGVGDPIFGDFGMVFSILYGLIIIFIGVLDHLRLVRFFQPQGAGINARNH